MKLFITLILACFTLGCVSLNKATKKVLTDDEATNVVGLHWRKSHPCVNDTVMTTNTDTIVMPGKSSITIQRVGDTVFVNQKDTIYKTHKQTITNTVTDWQLVNIYKDSSNYYNGLAIQKDGQIQAQKEELNQDKKEISKLTKSALFYKIGLVTLSVFGFGLGCKIKSIV